MSRQERQARENRKLAEYSMMLLYLGILVIVRSTRLTKLISTLLTFVTGMDMNPFLSFELLFALIYVECKRNPTEKSMLWFIVVESKAHSYLDTYMPFALLLFSMITGGNIIGDLIGIAAGHVYYFLKDICPIVYGYDILKTPQFLYKLFND